MSETNVSVINLIIDVPPWQVLLPIVKALQHARINGHNVLYAGVKNPRPKDSCDIPHPGHNHTCREKPERCTELSMNYTRPCRRYFYVFMVVEGSFYLADQEVDRYHVRGALVILSGVHVVAEIPEIDRVELTPWDNARVKET